MVLHFKWQIASKLIKSSKIVGGKSTHFCLGHKIEIGHWDPHFALRSKTHVFGCTILQVILILISNKNCVGKSLGLI